MELSSFELEKEMARLGFNFVIGVDEAGRGPLAGPVVACATTVRNDKFPMTNDKSDINDSMWELVRDSKKLSEKQREKVFDFIQENFYVGVGLCNHETIDRINILEASFLAMKKAIQELERNMRHATRDKVNSKTIILVDGNKNIPNLSLEQKAIVGGDRIVKSISAASIIAKVTRDRLMLEMHKKYPQYGFDKHKGYGTKMHMDMLEKFGPCEIHRKSFAPVKKALMTFQY